MKIETRLLHGKKKAPEKKADDTFEFMNQHSQSEGFFNSFCNDPQNDRYFRGQSQLCPAYTVICRQDTPADAVYLLENGLVKLVRITSSGDQVIVGLRHRNWLIGAPSIFLDKEYSYTAITVLPTFLRSITKKNFLELVENNVQFSLHIHRLLSSNIYSQMRRIEETSFMPAQERLELLLSEMIHNHGSTVSKTPDKFALPLTNQELAQLLAISPEHLCRVLKAMEQEGLIKRDRGTVIVANPSQFPQKSVD